MKSLVYFSVAVLVLSLSACSPSQNQTQQVALSPAPVSPETTGEFTGKRGEYQMIQTAQGYTVKELAGAGKEVNIKGLSRLVFSDYSVNLNVGTKSKTIAASDVQRARVWIRLPIIFITRRSYIAT
ncbi:MAG: hypothetical protein HYR92_04150 [Burkholderiales bacterium]|nr:hypothetical protein [Burkholderiales bacterium]